MPPATLQARCKYCPRRTIMSHLIMCPACRTDWAEMRNLAVKHMHQAIRASLIPHQTTRHCADCGIPANVYWHPDYNQPATVIPVCYFHKMLRGYGLPSAAFLAKAAARNITPEHHAE